MSGQAFFTMGPDIQGPVIACPYCGLANDCFSEVTPTPGEDRPQDGNMSVCIACAGVAVFFGGATKLRRPTPDEWGALSQLQVTQVAVQAVIEARSRDSNWPAGPDSPRRKT